MVLCLAETATDTQHPLRLRVSARFRLVIPQHKRHRIAAGAGPRNLRLPDVQEGLRVRRTDLRPLVHPLGQTRSPPPDEIIEPLRHAARNEPPDIAAGVRNQLALELADLQAASLVVLAGEQYRTVLLGSRWPAEVPMKVLGIGQQLGWLTGRLSA